jgi:hypothetical protein
MKARERNGRISKSKERKNTEVGYLWNGRTELASEARRRKV